MRNPAAKRIGPGIFAVYAALAIAPAFGDGLHTESGTLASLFPAAEVQALASTLPAAQSVTWKVYVPERPAEKSEPNGVLVYASPIADAKPDPKWLEVFEDKHLIWVAAEGYGNTKPNAQRVLAAIMGLAKVQQLYKTDNHRIYIAGLSGGGRIASETATKFPRMFNGALYVAGSLFWTPAETPLLGFISRNRYVFLTGSKDFSRHQVLSVYKKYKEAGIKEVLLMDFFGYGHHNPNAAQLAAALQFLDGAATPVE
jgi:predicted esterase